MDERQGGDDAVRQKTVERTTLIVACLTSFLGPFSISSVNVALPALERTFSLDVVQLSWIATAYLIGMAVAIVPGGKLADIYGRRKFLLFGIVLYTLGCCIGCSAPSYFLLLLARIMQGIGSALTNVTGVSILTSVFPPAERGKVLGIYVSAVYVGLATGPLIGGLFTEYLGWRYLFVLMACSGFFSFILTLFWLRAEWFGKKGVRFSLSGALLYSVAIFAVVYGASTVASPAGLGMLLFGIVVSAFFVYHQLRSEFPVFDVRFFIGNRIFFFSSLAAFLHYSATFAVTIMLSLYLQYIHGKSAESAGMILMIQPVIMAVASPLSGLLSDRIGSQLPATLGMAITFAGALLLIFVSDVTSLFSIMAILVLLGVGFALFSSPNMNAIMGSVRPQEYGLASETASIMRLLGQMFSMAIMTTVLSVIVGKKEMIPRYYSLFLESFHIIFAISAFCCLLGIVFSWYRGGGKNSAHSSSE